jgi:hypothetical protein
MPIPLKKELTSQLPLLKKQNLKHVDYAQKAIQELLPEDKIKASLVREGNYFKSAVAINNGNGNFTLQALPAEVQLSCVKAILVQDLNGDGKNDLVLAGNDAGFMPQFSKLDASFGHVLLNQGNGQYLRIENRDSGFFVRGDVKSLLLLPVNGKKNLLVTINNKQPRLFQLK